jgi:hypothetical protein
MKKEFVLAQRDFALVRLYNNCQKKKNSFLTSLILPNNKKSSLSKTFVSYIPITHNSFIILGVLRKNLTPREAGDFPEKKNIKGRLVLLKEKKYDDEKRRKKEAFHQASCKLT